MPGDLLTTHSVSALCPRLSSSHDEFCAASSSPGVTERRHQRRPVNVDEAEMVMTSNLEHVAPVVVIL